MVSTQQKQRYCEQNGKTKAKHTNERQNHLLDGNKEHDEGSDEDCAKRTHVDNTDTDRVKKVEMLNHSRANRHRNRVADQSKAADFEAILVELK